MQKPNCDLPIELTTAVTVDSQNYYDGTWVGNSGTLIPYSSANAASNTPTVFYNDYTTLITNNDPTSYCNPGT